MTRATARYKYGRSSDQRAGRAIVRSWAISVTEPPGTRPVVDTTATAFPAESYMVVRNAIACSAGRALRTTMYDSDSSRIRAGGWSRDVRAPLIDVHGARTS